MLSLSYSSIEDIYALARDEPDEKEELLKLAEDLEQVGVGYYLGQEFALRETRHGLEVVSTEDLLSEEESEYGYNFKI